jgi:hypothetical protein
VKLKFHLLIVAQVVGTGKHVVGAVQGVLVPAYHKRDAGQGGNLRARVGVAQSDATLLKKCFFLKEEVMSVLVGLLGARWSFRCRRCSWS